MKKQILPGLLILSALLAVFGRSCFFPEMVFDDVLYIGRPHLLTLTWQNICFWWDPVLGLWSPLAGYSFMLDHLLWGKHLFFGAHLTNILLHAVSAYAVFLTAKQLKIPEKTAFFLTLFWAVHPLRPESVVWISERKDMLIMSLGVWCIYLFCRQAEKGRISPAAMLLFALSFAVKPALAGMPVILMLLTVPLLQCWDWRKMLRLSAGFWAVLAVWLGLFFALSAEGGAVFSINITRMAWQLGHYFWKNFYWLELNPVYPDYTSDMTLFPFVLLCGVFLLVLYFCRKEKAWALNDCLPLFLCFGAAIAPCLFRIGNNDLADRYTCFSSLFILLMPGLLYDKLEHRFPARKKIFRFLVLSVIAAAAVLCFFRVSIWKSSDSCVAAALNAPRPNYRMLMASAAGSFQTGDYARALQIADRLKADYTALPGSLYKDIVIFSHALESGVLLRTGRLAEGRKHLSQLLDHPDWDRMQYASYSFSRQILLLGAAAYAAENNTARAVSCYRRLALIYGRFEPMEKYFYCGVAALVSGDRPEALKYFELAHRANPSDENVRKNLEMLRASGEKRTK